MAVVTKPPILDETGQDILTQLRRIADAKESNLMGYGGAVLFANLPNPTESNLNIFYLIKDAFTTDSRFVVGPGVSVPAGKYYCVINIGTEASPVCKYDELGELIDLSAKQDKALSSAIVIGGVTASTVEAALGELNTYASGKVETAQGSANVGKILKVNSSGNLELAAMSDSTIKTASNTYSANDASCSVSLNLEDGNYLIEVYCSEESVTKTSVTYSSSVITVTFNTRPASSGTMWVVARKVS